MSKEYWLHCYECAIENIAEEQNVEMDKAEKILNEILDKDTHYLDGYLSY